MSSGTNKERIEQNNNLIQNNNTKITNVTTVVNTLSGLTKTEYNACLELANSIETDIDYADATATAEDIKEGKIAYAKGERLVGIMKPYNLNVDTSELKVFSGTNLVACITEINMDEINTDSLTSVSFANFTKLQKITGTIKIPDNNDTRSMFNGCENLTNFPISGSPSGIANASRMYYNCKKLKQANVSITYAGTGYGDKQYMFYGCENLESVNFSSNKNGVLSPNGKLQYMFQGCTNLKDFKLSGSAMALGEYLTDMFKGCTNLTTESLNYILLGCANSNCSTSKSLKTLGLTEEQATICQTLSNYETFTNAGWVTGY